MRRGTFASSRETISLPVLPNHEAVPDFRTNQILDPRGHPAEGAARVTFIQPEAS